MALTKVRGSGIDADGQEIILDADTDTSITSDTDDQIDFKIGGNDRVTIDSSGNVFVAKSSASRTTVGHELKASGFTRHTVSGDKVLEIVRTSSDGEILEFFKDSTLLGVIGAVGGDIYVGTGDTGFRFIDSSNSIVPITTSSTGATRDNAIDLGDSGGRFDDIHATNGTIQTSDQNEKQDTASLTTKELNVAKKLSTLFKTFRWKDKVAEKGDKARTHTGIIAQEVESAFSAEGLDASKYGLFTSDTWTNDDGKEQTRLGVRYPELFSFIFSSIDARLTALESK